MMVLATSETTTSGVFSVLSDATVTCGDMPAVLAGFRESGRHLCCGEGEKRQLMGHRI